GRGNAVSIPARFICTSGLTAESSMRGCGRPTTGPAAGCQGTWGAADLRRFALMLRPSGSRRRFQLMLIKPSHYDDDGYIIQWLLSFMPSNTLAVMSALGHDASDRRILGEDVEIELTILDEMNTRFRVSDVLARFRRCSGFGLVGLVGVQSNQFPRAVDIARPLRAAGIPVVIGGFHVSG